MYDDHEFDALTPEEQAQRAAQEAFARRVRQEVRRIDRGEAEAEMRAEAEEENRQREEQQAEADERERREQRRASSTFWQLVSGTILLQEGVSQYYRYLFCIAVMFFLSIVVMFTALHLDRRYSRLERDVQMLRERSVRLQEQRYRITTHSAVTQELQRRGIDLYDPLAPSETIEN